jgi:hypothetical protein
MVTSNRILKAGIYSQGILLDESKDALADLEKLPAKHYKQTVSIAGLFWERWLTDILPVMTSTPKWHEFVKNLKVNQLVLVISPKTDQRCEWPQGIIHECIANADGAVRRVQVQILTAKGKEHVFLERPIRQIIPLDMMWDDPRLELPMDAAEALNWPLKHSETVGSDNLTPKVKDNLDQVNASLPPTLESFKTTTTARVDQEVAKIGKLIADEMGPTTRSRRKLLEAYEADEVERQIQQEADQSAALAQIIEEGKCPYSD